MTNCDVRGQTDRRTDRRTSASGDMIKFIQKKRKNEEDEDEGEEENEKMSKLMRMGGKRKTKRFYFLDLFKRVEKNQAT